MKQPIRYFSIGLLTASLLLLIGYYFFKPDIQPMSNTLDEMIVAIEDEGYRVITESEYISFAVKDHDPKTNDEEETNKEEGAKEDKEANKQKDKEDSNKKEESEKEDKKENDNKEKEKDKEKQKETTYTLVIEENMVPSTISKILEDNNIIDSATQFNQFLEDNDYSKYMQIGEFKFSTGMSMEEVAKVLTNK